MRDIHVSEITAAVAELCIEANHLLGDDLLSSLEAAKGTERSKVGKGILDELLRNAEEAAKGIYPICQDTGMTVCFVEVGQDVHIWGGTLEEAVNLGVSKGYSEGSLRKSMVKDPILRGNTGDNTPAIIHTRLVSGDQIKVTIAPKGAGSENMSQVKMLKPSDGVEGVKKYILEVVDAAGPNPCPPLVIGVGLGGNLEKVCLLAKIALLREIGVKSPIHHIARLEEELLSAVNNLGIGPQGFGGTTTALAVNIEVYPTHIASLPVAVNINCHVARHRSRVI